MVAKSIISVEVDDSKFKAFKELFDKYQTALDKMPAAWKAASTEQQGLMRGFANVSAAMMAHADLAKKVSAEGQRGASEADHQAKSWQSIACDSKEVAANVASMTRSFVKWSGMTTLFTGLLGGGGLWGFTHLAGSVAAMRQSAAGLGITPGQQTAFGVDFGRFLSSPQGTLSAVAAALTDPTSPAYRPLAALLGNVQGQNAADVTSRLLQTLPRLFPGGAHQQNLGTIAQAYGLTDILSVEDIKRYLSASPEERRRQERSYRGDVSRFELDPRTQRAYQDFMTQLDRAGNSIFTVFVQGLKPLAGPLAHLSDSVSHVVAAFFKAANDRHWIEEVSGALEKFASYVGTPEFDRNVKSFVDGIGSLANSISGAVFWLNDHLPSSSTAGAKVGALLGGVAGGAIAGGPGVAAGAVAGGWLGSKLPQPHTLWTTLNQSSQAMRLMNDLVTKYHWSPEAAAVMAGNVAIESGFNPRQIGDHGTSGGLAQWHRDRFARLKRESGGNWTDWNAQVRLMDEEWRERFGAAIKSHDTAYLGKLARQYEGYSTNTYAKRMMAAEVFGQQYKGYERERAAKVEITKATGADVNVSMQQLATYGIGSSTPLP